jgi:hypothetical protein
MSGAAGIAGAGGDDVRSGPPTGGPWAIRLSRADASSVAAALRLRPKVHAALDVYGGAAGAVGGSAGDGDLWLRGDAMDESLDRIVRQLAPAARFSISTTGGGEELIPYRHLLPVGRLSGALQWMPLHELLTVERPTSAMPGSKPSPVKITIVRAETERPAAMLRTSLATWAAYADTAPGVRLRALRFAAKHDEVVIAGRPLPPLPGVRLWVSDGIAVPCGWTWSPPVDAITLRRALALREHDVALFAEDGTWQYVPAEAFVAARRSAVRRTAAAQQEATS